MDSRHRSKNRPNVQRQRTRKESRNARRDRSITSVHTARSSRSAAIAERSLHENPNSRKRSSKRCGDHQEAARSTDPLSQRDDRTDIHPDRPGLGRIASVARSSTSLMLTTDQRYERYASWCIAMRMTPAPFGTWYWELVKQSEL